MRIDCTVRDEQSEILIKSYMVIYYIENQSYLEVAAEEGDKFMVYDNAD